MEPLGCEQIKVNDADKNILDQSIIRSEEQGNYLRRRTGKQRETERDLLVQRDCKHFWQF